MIQSLVLLSDIPTPSFIIDIDSLPSESNTKDSPPFLNLPKYSRKLSPMKLTTQTDNNENECFHHSDCYDFQQRKQFENSVGYLHSSVLRGREHVNDSDEPKETFLAEIDLSERLCYFPAEGKDNENINKETKAHLVLGLNNHHVGSYYWARSAGMGSSMEAPGISFDSSNNVNENNSNNGILRWDAEGGPFVCNSNDGKRSEWVNFLRIGDNIQLLPHFEEDAIMAFLEKYGTDIETSRIYGVSSKGRPLGSEPMIVCKWVE